MPAKVIVQVFFKPNARISTRNDFELIEVDGFDDFRHVCEFVENNERIYGEILVTSSSDKRDERVIWKRKPVMFSGESVDRIQMPTWFFVEGEDAQG